jgi:Kef-type K+ transport system membrane component KefB
VQFLAFAMFIGVAMSITAFPVLARILTHTGLIDTKIGTLALASAAIDDVVAWCLLTLVAAVATAGDAVSFLRVAGLSFAYVAFMLIVMRPLLRVQMRRWMRLSSPPPHAIAVVMAGLLLSAYMTTVIGIHPIFGAFLFGLVMPRDSAHGNPSTSQIHITSTSLAKFCEPFEQLGLLLLPVFFIVTGLGVDVVSLGMNGLMELVAIVTIACAGKLIGAAVPARLCGMTWSEAKTLGLLMNTRGLTELIVLNTGVSLGILDSQMFTMMVIMAVVTTSMAGPLIRHTPIELSKASDDTRQRPLVHADLA